MQSKVGRDIQWQSLDVASPVLQERVSVVAAKGIPYLPHANRFQTLNLYLRKTEVSENLIGSAPSSFGGLTADRNSKCLVYVHGGAWRDPLVTADSIEAAVAWAFRPSETSSAIQAIASINYTLSAFPSRDSLDPHRSDPAREAVHPQHVKDVLTALSFLRSFGLDDRSYVLAGHSAGACITFQAILQCPACYGLDEVTAVPCPAAMLGLNGLYDLDALVEELGPSHEHLRGDYESLLSAAFGKDQKRWAAASPSCFDSDVVSNRVREGKIPHLLMLDQSADDQLVPLNQRERFTAHLEKSKELSILWGARCKGQHADPWQQGLPVWECVQDLVAHLS